MDKILVYVEWLSERRLWRVRCNPKAPDWAKELLEAELRHKNTLIHSTRELCRQAAKQGDVRIELYIKKRNRQLGNEVYAHTVYGG